MIRLSSSILFLELLVFCAGAFSGSGYFVWASLFSLIVYRLCISTTGIPHRVEYGITPNTLYKAFWYFLLVLSPLINNLWKPPQFPLPFLPSNTQNNYALLIISFAAIASSLGYRVRSKRSIHLKANTLLNPPFNKNQSRIMILIGVVGICLLLGLTVLTVGLKSSFVSLTPEASSLPKFLSIILPPFVLHGLILQMSSKVAPRKVDYMKFLFLLGLSLIPFSLYRLNRASIFIPILAILIPLIRSKSKLTIILIWSILFLFGALAVQSVGNFRAEQLVTRGGQISLETSGFVKGPSVKTALFNYLNAYEYIGYGLQEINRDEFSLATPLYSIASPLPKLSRFDDQRLGGTGIYNRSIYHKNVYDQICSTVLEVFLSWGLMGLGIFFFFQGVLMRYIEIKFNLNSTLYSRFFLTYSGFWVAFTPSISISVLTQIFFYNVLFVAIFLKFLRFQEEERF